MLIGVAITDHVLYVGILYVEVLYSIRYNKLEVI